MKFKHFKSQDGTKLKEITFESNLFENDKFVVKSEINQHGDIICSLSEDVKSNILIKYPDTNIDEFLLKSSEYVSENKISNLTSITDTGMYKPKKKYLSFIQGIRGGVRFTYDKAYLKSEKITGTIDNVKFEIIIYNDGTIDFDEIGTNQCDEAMIKRFIDDIDTFDVTGYMNKYILHGIDFINFDNSKLYLEVHEDKPIDKLFDLINNIDQSNKASENALSKIDSLFDDIEDETNVVKLIETEDTISELIDTVQEQSHSQKLMQEAFDSMNKEKINELSNRIEKKEQEITKYNIDIKQNKSKLKEATESLNLLNSRIDSLKPNDDPNGYVFNVSIEQKEDISIDEKSMDIIKKISSVMKIDKEVLTNLITSGYFTIRISKKEDINQLDTELNTDVYQKIKNIDFLGKIKIIDNNTFEYRGDFNWGKIVNKMVKMGFEQCPEFDKKCGSVSYQSESDLTPIPLTENIKDNKEDETSFKGKKIVTYTEPTTIVLVGSYSDNHICKITDDESSFSLYIDGKIHKEYGSFGFVSLYDIKQYKQELENNPDEFDENVISGFVLPNFVGTIEASARIRKNDEKYNIFSDDFDIDDYIQHQFEEYAEVIINVPKGTNVVELNNDLSLPLPVLRDVKITDIINK